MNQLERNDEAPPFDSPTEREAARARRRRTRACNAGCGRGNPREKIDGHHRARRERRRQHVLMQHTGVCCAVRVVKLTFICRVAAPLPLPPSRFMAPFSVDFLFCAPLPWRLLDGSRDGGVRGCPPVIPTSALPPPPPCEPPPLPNKRQVCSQPASAHDIMFISCQEKIDLKIHALFFVMFFHIHSKIVGLTGRCNYLLPC